jgi:serine/threonine protein kinase
MAVLRNEWAAEDGDGDYVAPEMLSSNNVPGTAADIYSLGVTMYECATLKKLPRSGAGRLAENIFTPGRLVVTLYMNTSSHCMPRTVF